MASWGSYSFLFGPALALLVIGLLLALARRMTRGNASLIERPSRPGAAEEYGLMIPVASPTSARAADQMAARLASVGLRSRVVGTTDGLRLMVWAEDVPRAREVLDSSSG